MLESSFGFENKKWQIAVVISALSINNLDENNYIVFYCFLLLHDLLFQEFPAHFTFTVV